MSHLSPASLLVWAILTSLVGMFYIFHLWSFDRFKCLKWNHSTEVFKRFMTYSYLLAIPLIGTYATGMTAIKYYEGFVANPLHGIIPKPMDMWSPLSRSCYLPLLLCLSIGWSLELVTHLEELCFWLFLFNSNSAQQNWFHSFYFKSWIFGSIVAVIYMPVITITMHSDPLKAEGYTFLAGSLGSLSLTLWFTPVLFMFPSFLHNVRSEGVDTNTIVRLTRFSELNMIRIFFRFVFTIPLLILGIDGVRPHHHINENMFWTDLLVMMASFGCSISSAITLLIFFPRSIESEIAAREERKRSKIARNDPYEANLYKSPKKFTRTDWTQQSSTHTSTTYDIPVFGSTACMLSAPLPDVQPKLDADSLFESHQSHAIRLHESSHTRARSTEKFRALEEDVVAMPPLRPNRKTGSHVDLGNLDQIKDSKRARRSTRSSNSRVNQIVHNFTSPIDLPYTNRPSGDNWLSFSKS